MTPRFATTPVPKSDYLQIRISPADKVRLRRRAQRAGKDVSTYVLGRVLPAQSDEFERLVEGARGPEATYALAALHDFLAALGRHDFARAVEGDPLRRTDETRFASYVAAMVEHTAAKVNQRPPKWTVNVMPLESPWFASDLLSLRLHLLLNARASFRARNLFVARRLEIASDAERARHHGAVPATECCVRPYGDQR